MELYLRSKQQRLSDSEINLDPETLRNINPRKVRRYVKRSALKNQSSTPEASSPYPSSHTPKSVKSEDDMSRESFAYSGGGASALYDGQPWTIPTTSYGHFDPIGSTMPMEQSDF